MDVINSKINILKITIFGSCWNGSLFNLKCRIISMVKHVGIIIIAFSLNKTAAAAKAPITNRKNESTILNSYFSMEK